MITTCLSIPVLISLLLNASVALSVSFSDQLQSYLYRNQLPLMQHSDAVSLGQRPSSAVTISDVIGKTEDIGIFSSLTRIIDAISARLEDASFNATILAPNNAAMKSLPQKPWEDKEDYKVLETDAHEGQSAETRANANMQRFLEAHIVPESPWNAGQKVKTLTGNTVWYEITNGKKIVQPGGTEVLAIADRVANGEVWILKGVINYA